MTSTEVTAPGTLPATPGDAPEYELKPMDFWGASEEHKFVFPGQEKIAEQFRQYIIFKSMDEGARARFQKATNHSVTIEKASQNARLGVDPAGDRWALIQASVTDWRVFRGGEEVLFKPYVLTEWLKVAPPMVVDDLERAIREANPWMLAEMNSEAIEQEIDNLTLRLAETKAREEAEKDFSNK